MKILQIQCDIDLDSEHVIDVHTSNIATHHHVVRFQAIKSCEQEQQ